MEHSQLNDTQNTRAIAGNRFSTSLGLALLSLSIILLFSLNSVQIAWGQGGADTVRQIRDYERELKSIHAELIKIITAAKRNSRSQWHRQCDHAQSALDRIDTSLPILATLVEKERRNWQAMHSIGGEMAHLNELIEFKLQDCAKETLQAVRDEQEWKKRLKNYADESKKNFQDVMRKFNDVERLAQLTLGKDVGEFPGVFDDFLQGVDSLLTKITLCKNASQSSHRLYHSIFVHSRGERLRYHEAITQNVRASRRQLERLISLDMVPAEDDAIDSIEEKVEKLVKQRLEEYQQALDSWVDVYRPLSRDFDDFAFDVVGGTMTEMIKMVPAAAFGGIPFPSIGLKADEAVEVIFERVGVAVKASASLFAKDTASKLALQRGEEIQALKEDLDKIKITFDSQESVARDNSLKETQRLEHRLNKRVEQQTKMAKDSFEYSTTQNEIEEIREEIELEKKATDRELTELKQDRAAAIQRREEQHEIRLALIQSALAEAKK